MWRILLHIFRTETTNYDHDEVLVWYNKEKDSIYIIDYRFQNSCTPFLKENIVEQDCLSKKELFKKMNLFQDLISHVKREYTEEDSDFRTNMILYSFLSRWKLLNYPTEYYYISFPRNTKKIGCGYELAKFYDYEYEEDLEKMLENFNNDIYCLDWLEK